MKRILMLLMAIFAITATQAQQKVTLAQCQGDTVTYLKKMFDEGKSRFIGQPFSKVVEEWRSQMPINRITFRDTGNWPTKESEKYLVTGAYLDFITERDANMRRMRKEASPSVYVDFAPPYNQKIDGFWLLQEQEDSQLGPQLYEKLKDYIIQDISVVGLK